MRPRGRTTILAVAGFALLAYGCDDARRELTVPDVLLRVTDSSCPTATVRWGDGSPNDTELVVDLPWSRDIGTASGLVLVLTARRECDDSGAVTAEIALDGALEDRGTASGPRAVAAASTSFF